MYEAMIMVLVSLLSFAIPLVLVIGMFWLFRRMTLALEDIAHQLRDIRQIVQEQRKDPSDG